jgi:hypothetical protein
MKRSSLAVVATAFVLVTGCVSSSQAKGVKPSGAYLVASRLLPSDPETVTGSTPSARE